MGESLIITGSSACVFILHTPDVFDYESIGKQRLAVESSSEDVKAG
jgi:hypothetical protein